METNGALSPVAGGEEHCHPEGAFAEKGPASPLDGCDAVTSSDGWAPMQGGGCISVTLCSRMCAHLPTAPEGKEREGEAEGVEPPWGALSACLYNHKICQVRAERTSEDRVLSPCGT